MKTYHLGLLQDMYEAENVENVEVFGYQIAKTEILKRFYPHEFSRRANEWIDEQIRAKKLFKWESGPIADEPEPKAGPKHVDKG